MPWRRTKDPYFIWLSEIILQQTRVEQGLPYYNRFVSQFPTVHDLAAADSQKVMKAWEGLGYYSRARNLHYTAKYISEILNGAFPKSYDGLIKLKGVGPYTAAAIASIAFKEPKPVIDGNVFRFISRYFGVEKDIGDQKNRKFFEEILDELIPSDQPDIFNQATMEFGATVCKPAPDCSSCIFRSSCFARINNRQNELPIKVKKVKVQEQFIAYMVIKHKDQTLMRVRNESIWNGLFEFPSKVSEQNISDIELSDLLSNYPLRMTRQHAPVKHLLTHRKLWVSFHEFEVSEEKIFVSISKDLEYNIFSWEEILTLPLPKVISNHLQRVEF